MPVAVMPVIAILAANRQVSTVLRVDPAAAIVESGAYATVHAAQQALRAGVGRGTERIVQLAAGSHHLESPLLLDSRDSGEPGAPIRWVGVGDGRSEGNGKPSTRLSGGVAIPQSAWSPYTTAGGVSCLKADLFSLGFNASTIGSGDNNPLGELAELFINGKPATLARTPNIAPDGTWMWYGYEALIAGAGCAGTSAASCTNFSMRGASDVVAALRRAFGAGDKRLWLHGYWKFDWRDTFVLIDSVTGPDADALFARSAATPPSYPFTSGARFYGVNSLAFLDAENEYFIDRERGVLYWLPPGGVLPPATDAVVSRLLSVVSSHGAAHHSFEGLVLSDARGSVLAVSEGTNVSVRSSTVSNSGGSCMAVQGTNNSVVANRVWGCGGSGVVISSGDVTTLAPGGSSVTHNAIANFSRIKRTYQPAVGFEGVGLYVAHNDVRHGPHTAMQGGGNEHLFEFNNLTHIAFECTDTGAFYVGRSWSQRGNVVRYNRFDTVRPTERLAQKSCSQNAFYLDDQMSGYDFYGNTIINSTTGVLLGGGRRNRIHGNTFLHNDLDVAFDNRGMNWMADYCTFNCTAPGRPDAAQAPGCFRTALEKLHYQAPPYSTRGSVFTLGRLAAARPAATGAAARGAATGSSGLASAFLGCSTLCRGGAHARRPWH